MNETTPPAEDETGPARVESRWWYWIAAYPLATLLVIPMIVLVVIAAVVPIVVLGPEPAPAAGIVWALLVFVAAILLFTLLIGLLIVSVMLPVALYFDALAVREAHLEWDPDPLVYGLVALLQFFVTPIIGLLVALYYLYRRHEAVGIP